ncbi:MAG: hypothetical protein ACRDRP_04495 [Pseudonocardiaceae bacterium]
MSSEPTSDALFGVDGTQSPELWPGLSRGTGRDAPELPPFALPPLPDFGLTPEAIAAALGEDPTGPVDQDPAAARTPSAEPGGSPAPQPGGSPAPQPDGSPAPRAEPAPPATGQAPASAATGSSSRSSPLAPPLFPSTSSRSRRTARLRRRQPVAAGSGAPVPAADLHQRVGRDRPGVPRSSSANLALGAVLFVSLIIVAVLMYYIITGILESMSRLFP